MKKHKPVPPTSFYYGKRADLFLSEALRALSEGQKEKHAELVMRAEQYRDLAGQMPLEVGDTHGETIHRT
jgi:hypothetical protein